MRTHSKVHAAAIAATLAVLFASEVSQFVAQHIEDTVQRWDAQEMSALIELNIGKDLQYIRINGTVVGGLIGLVLFAVSHAGEMARALSRVGG